MAFIVARKNVAANGCGPLFPFWCWPMLRRRIEGAP
jgi:hypothetical protein